VAVGAAASGEEQTESGGLPGWAWALIGAASVVLITCAITVIRGRRAASHAAANAEPPSGPPAF
jgi:hypothetical protein